MLHHQSLHLQLQKNINFASLKDGSSVKNLTYVKVNAPIGTRNVKLYVDGKLVRQENAAPYEWATPKDALLQDLRPGKHTLKAVVLDNKSKSSTISIQVSVNTSSARESSEEELIEESVLELLTVFPNPSENGVFKLNHSTNWEVYSIEGLKIMEGNSDQIDLSSEHKGVFILKTAISNQRLVIQ